MKKYSSFTVEETDNAKTIKYKIDSIVRMQCSDEECEEKESEIKTEPKKLEVLKRRASKAGSELILGELYKKVQFKLPKEKENEKLEKVLKEVEEERSPQFINNEQMEEIIEFCHKTQKSSNTCKPYTFSQQKSNTTKV